MPGRSEYDALTCEQCGAPLSGQATEYGCLNCLLTAGMANDAATKTVSPDESGTVFYQHYEILHRPDGTRWELGRGAMGVTYKARDVNLDTPVALKIINAHFSTRPDARRLFLNEAQAAARLRHPNVASVFHFGTINALPDPTGAASTPAEIAEAGDCFYTMEFIEGETLEARIRRAGPLPPVTALQIALQVTRALVAAERRGLIHRDLKPSNIMLAAEEDSSCVNGAPGEAWVKVIDFGLATLEPEETPTASSEFLGSVAFASAEEEETPRRAEFLGTVAFASPEQVQVGKVDGRADIYSLGVTLWYALAGAVPFPPSAAGKARGASLPSLPVNQLVRRGVPAPIIALLQSMLAPDPALRPASAMLLGTALQGCLENLADTRSPAPGFFGNRRRLWAGAIGIAAFLGALAAYFSSTGVLPDDKSIAVLPFKNLSHDPDSAFFAEGIEDDILSRLVKIRDLKVIGHPSSSRYSADEERNFGEIGRSLGVRHVIQGSLRRDGNHIVLNVALIDTRNGHELWAECYDRSLADSITLQGELATAIAGELDATLTPQEKVEVRAKPTGNPGAYLLYLRGRKFENSPSFAISDFEQAQALYTQAIALDPGFALAHARRSITLAYLYRFRGPSDELKDRAHADAAEALRLNSDLGEAHLANGLCFYRIERDYDKAIPELETARRLLPNDTEAESIFAYINRRRGHWREARAGIERVWARDPRNVILAEELYTTGYALRDWDYAAKYIRQAEGIAPTVVLLSVERSLVDVWRNGNLAPLQKVFADLTTFGDPEGTVAWMRWDAAMLGRNFETAAAAIDGFPFETLASVYSAPVSKNYLRGCVALAKGESDQAEHFFELARPQMEAETVAHPEDGIRHARLGLLYAYMGRKAEAIREGERAMELDPVSLDAFDGPQHLTNLALIYARLGENDRAISMIDSLLKTPGTVQFCESSMSLSELRLRWQWDPLRKDPRFQKILAAPEPPTIY